MKALVVMFFVSSFILFRNMGISKAEATRKTIKNDKIVYTYGFIPDGHGPTALMKQLGIEIKK